MLFCSSLESNNNEAVYRNSTFPHYHPKVEYRHETDTPNHPEKSELY